MSSSAEKTEDPTYRRLEDSREKGQVPQSKQVSAIFVVAVGVGTCFAFWNRTSAHIMEIIVYTSSSVGRPWREALPELFDKIIGLAGGVILPILLFLCVAMIVGKIICSGFSFSFDPMAPNLAKFNIASNIKQLFSVATFYNLIFMIVVSVFSTVIGWKVFVNKQRDLAYSIYCGLPCISLVILEVFFWILMPVIGILFLWSFAEIIVQRAIFRMNMKMTKDEVKREAKDNYGDPQIRGARTAVGREMATSARLSDTTFVVTGKDIALGFQYHPRFYPVPILLFKFRGKGAQSLIIVAKKNMIPVFYRSDLASSMIKGQPVGISIKRAFYRRLVELTSQINFADGKHL